LNTLILDSRLRGNDELLRSIPHRRILRAALALSLAIAVAGCATTQTEPPKLDLPAATETKAPVALDSWWTLFGDAALTGLVDEALANNLDLRAAVARIDLARANLLLATSYLYPSVDLNANPSRAKRSAATSFPQGPPFISTTHTVGLSAAYEVDLWGKLRSGQSAAESTLLASQYDAQTVRTTLAAQVANTYFTLTAADAELALSRRTLETRDASVRLQQARRKAGLVSALDVKQAEAARASVAASIPPLQKAIALLQSSLAVLTGRSPRDVYTPTVKRGREIESYANAPDVPPGLPSDLLARRPDIRQAEANLAAADFRVSEARARYFPSLVLTGAYGSESATLANLFTGPAGIWSIAATLVQPIIGLKSIEAQVEAATARRNLAEIGYVQAVQSAFRDVHDALVSHTGARDSYLAQEERRAQLADALKLSDRRYRAGYTGYLDVLAAQRDLLEAEREQLIALRNQQTALVDLYRALGGGWEPRSLAANNK
jgi:multidrug efflux system outer membrane protein